MCDFESSVLLDQLAAPATPSATSPSPSPAQDATLSVPRPSPSVASPSQARATPVVSQPEPDTSRPVDRLLELRLLHQYTTSTCKTLLTSSPATDDIWQKAVPDMAFRGKTYLADAMLSVAALHLRSQAPTDKALVRASHAYSASTLAAYVGTLNNGITPDNAEALFLTAALIAFQATAQRIFIKDDTETTAKDASSRYTTPMAWFHAFQGVKTVVATSWQWIRNSNIVQAVIDSQPSFQLDLNPLGPNSFFGHLLDGLDDELANEGQDKASATSQGYFHAVSVLNWAHKNPFAPAALAFPATVSRRFVEVVEERRPRSLAILACFFALLKRMDSVWWLEDVTRREVMGLVSLFESGSPWWKHLEWPVRIALWDGGTIPPDVWGVDYEKEAESSTGNGDTMVSHIELFSKLTSNPQASASMSAQAELELMVVPLD
ncbi:C6 zinc finger protein [Metarhizium album ARSEF 1941]|uniref:C6 zinc finger protein n=1 Tax=Metarhizium album (strain ARSEF 1941) TaxID=1081103 RepID=A0A0B2WKJ2_METAS|nr:C6 zinc finger protein [Metarhizium album ARSEF 1941]KHN94453.1 C6 zinc finger protein [Metarhizium album ARSEF 1941]